jgi:MFS family permease
LSPTFRALRIRNYRLYAIGGVVSNTGTWMQRVAQDWLVLQLHHGSAAEASTALGLTTGLQFLPILLFSPYAGLVADRMSKRRLLQLTQAGMGLASLVLAGLALTGVVSTWMVFVVAFVFGIGSAFDAPARQAFVSEMVGPDDLANAVGLNSASFNLARVMGPALSGFMIAALGSGVRATGVVILLNGVSYLAVIGALQVMRPHELSPVARAPRGKGMITDAVRYVRGRPDLMLILVAAFFAGTFGMNFQMTSALMATQVYHQGPGEYGLLGTTLAVGSAGRTTGRPPAPAPRHPRRAGVRCRGGGARHDADVPHLRPGHAGARPLPADDAQRGQHHGAAQRAAGDARSRDGALHDGRDGRHARRRALRRLDRRHLRRPLDLDRGRRPDDPRRPPRGRALPRRAQPVAFLAAHGLGRRRRSRSRRLAARAPA